MYDGPYTCYKTEVFLTFIKIITVEYKNMPEGCQRSIALSYGVDVDK